MKVFLDTSSLVKLYHQEIDSETIQDYLLENNVEEIYLSELAKLEFCSAIWKKFREGKIGKEIVSEVVLCFQDDYNKFNWIKINADIIEQALKMLMKYGSKGLRTLDSLQFSSALKLKDAKCAFITSDNLLKSLFKEEGLFIV